MHDWKMELYWRLPVRIQEMCLSLYAGKLDRLYHGPEFEKWCRIFQEWESRGWEDTLCWQVARLKEILNLAVRHVPYYRSTFQGFDPHAIRSIEDLCTLPLLDKQRIREHEKEFLDERLNANKLFKDKTSGSTGTSLTIYWPAGPLQRFWAAHEVGVRYAVGVDRRTPRAMVGGRPVVRGDAASPPFWRYNRRWGQLYLSSYHISPKSAPGYIEAIRNSGVVWMTGYGSAIAALAESALEAGVAPVRLKAVVVSGDTLQPGMRQSIETFFQCRCYDHYGQAEGVCWIMECEHGRMHLVPTFGVLEILRADGSHCAPGEVGEIVATGLINEGMPLIRYRVGDYAAWAVEQRCDCGWETPIIEKLEGRVDDYLVTADGRKIGRLSTAMKRSPSIHSAQIVQDRPGHAYLLVRPGNRYRHEDAYPVRDDILERIGKFELEILEVPEIPKTPTGKVKLVVRLSERPEMRPAYEGMLKETNRMLSSVRVLILTSGHEALDGRVYAREACSVQQMGAQVLVVGKLSRGEPGEVAILPIRPPSSRLARFLFQPWRCVWAARRYPADIVHFHDMELLATLPVARLLWRRAKFVYDVHEDFGNLMLIRDWLPNGLKPVARFLTNIVERTLARLAHGIVGVTPPLADKFPHRHRVVAYNYAPRHVFEQAGRMARPAREREYDLVHLGTLNRRRAAFLAEVIEAFHALRPNARSLVFGAPPEAQDAIHGRLPAGCEVRGKVLYEEVPALLGNAKVGIDVHPWLDPHLAPALAVKVCEYMACGCAVVASSMPVLDRVLEEAQPEPDAIVILSGEEPRQYAEAVLGLVEAIERGHDPGASLRQTGMRHLAWEREAEKLGRFYLALLGK